uniref:EF-hand domain-containing protein n=1 Tax=Lotharella globosa TaxID=91324 RepID=A0A7S3YQE7_9EUKA
MSDQPVEKPTEAAPADSKAEPVPEKVEKKTETAKEQDGAKKEELNEVEEKEEAGKQAQPVEDVRKIVDTNDPDHPIRRRIREAFEPFDPDRNNTCDEREIRYIMRYLGAYPTEEDVSKVIIKQIKEDEEIRVRYDRFEEFMLEVIKDNRYPPDDYETLMQAFKVLDADGKGLIDEQVRVPQIAACALKSFLRLWSKH